MKVPCAQLELPITAGSRVWSAGTRTWPHRLGGTRDEGELLGRALLASSLLALSLGVPQATLEQLLWLALPSTQRSGYQNRASLCLPCSRWVRPISGHLLSLRDLVHSGPCSQTHVLCRMSPGNVGLTQEATAPPSGASSSAALRSSTHTSGARWGRPFETRGSSHKTKPGCLSPCLTYRAQGTCRHPWAGHFENGRPVMGTGAGAEPAPARRVLIIPGSMDALG